MGRGPKKARPTHIIEDMLFVRLKGVITPAEEQLTKPCHRDPVRGCGVFLFRENLLDKLTPPLRYGEDGNHLTKIPAERKVPLS
jgi:hypothetical protein